MVREIVKDEKFLSLKSEDADERDKALIDDLVDTFKANREHCVGMAMNMIGVRKNIITVAIGPIELVMINPVIVNKSGEYRTKECCLSLEGERECVRHKTIDVEYLNASFKKRKGTFSGFTAEVIEHEIDHLHGILI